jgi:hypothetical protein
VSVEVVDAWCGLFFFEIPWGQLEHYVYFGVTFHFFAGVVDVGSAKFAFQVVTRDGKGVSHIESTMEPIALHLAGFLLDL